tara:strand:- start:15 stop:440 length:426 start_codon:yes stop_codon:yes gene_type:complete
MTDRSEYLKNWRAKNKKKNPDYEKQRWEKRKENCQKYQKSEKGKKVTRTNDWKRSGIIIENIDDFYEIFVKTWECESCKVQMTEGKMGNTRRCLDHCHNTGQIRNIICHKCNQLRGVFDNKRTKLHTKVLLELHRYFILHN